MPFPRSAAVAGLLALALLPAAYAAALSSSAVVAQPPAGAEGRPLLTLPATDPPPERPWTISPMQTVPPFAMFLVDLFAAADDPALSSGAAPR